MKETKFSSRHDLWSTLLRDQRESGLTAKEFCRQRNIPLATFYKRASSSKKTSNSKSLIAVEVSDPVQEPFRMAFRGGISLYFAQTPDAEFLAELMRLVL